MINEYRIRPVNNGVILSYSQEGPATNYVEDYVELAFRNLNAAVRKIKAVEAEAEARLARLPDEPCAQ
jgi:hypothetical protein